MSDQLEKLHPLSSLCDAMNVKDVRTLTAACERYGVPVVVLSRQTRALRDRDYKLLLQRASQVRA